MVAEVVVACQKKLAEKAFTRKSSTRCCFENAFHASERVSTKCA